MPPFDSQSTETMYTKDWHVHRISAWEKKKAGALVPWKGATCTLERDFI